MNEEILKEKYQTMTPEAKRILFSSEAANDLAIICEPHNLTEDQVADIANELIMVLINLTPMAMLSDEIEKKGIQKEVAKIISDEIKENILQKTQNQSSITDKDKELAEKIRKEKMKLSEILESLKTS
jgi:hypothetical protein